MLSIQANSYVAQQVNSYLAPGPYSEWVVPDAGGAGNTDSGAFVYRATFDLTDYNPSSAVITGKWSTDNNGVDILINGVSTGFTSPDGMFATGYTPFTISKGFVAEVNTLDFIVNNFYGPTALRVEMSGSVATPTVTGKLRLQCSPF